MAKILFIGQSTRSFSYYNSSLYHLVKSGHIISFRFDEHFSNSKLTKSLIEFLELYPSEFKWMKKRNLVLQMFIFFIRELATYVWYISRNDQSKYYSIRWANLFPFPFGILLKQKFIINILEFDFVKSTIFYFSKLNIKCKVIEEDILNFKPDIILASPCNLRFSSEIDYVQQAKRLNIPVIFSILSWDNLTNKGLFHALPDLFLVWNDNHKRELQLIHLIDNVPIKIIGAQLFDKWLPKKSNIPVDEYILNISASPYILYLGSSTNIIQDESDILRNLLLELQLIDSSLKIIFKPHPFNSEKYKNLNLDKLILMADNFGLTESLTDIINFKYLIQNSIFVVGINTSGFLDSIIIGKPTFSYINHKFAETQSEAAHYKVLKKYNVLKEFNSFKEIFSGNNFDKEFHSLREIFISEFVWPNNNKSAGEIAASEIDEFLTNFNIKS
jgi:hypothetical protein